MELLSENYFEVVLAAFCCYDYRANTSEAIQKITTDKKIITNAPSVTVYWIAKNGWSLWHLARN